MTAPIESYGLIGDTRTAALISQQGAIDWMCAPRFDGEPIFGSLVGGAGAGTFLLGPELAADLVSRRYLPRTATLETTWCVNGSRLTLTEGMVAELGSRLLPTTCLVRRIASHGGTVDVALTFDPRLGEKRLPPRVRRAGDGLICDWGALALGLRTTLPSPPVCGKREVISVTPGNPLTAVLCIAEREPLILPAPASAMALLYDDQRRWRVWSQGIDASVPQYEAVLRSLLTLQLLTYSPSGAAVAAPTSSLPEDPGGSRNWDYRYAWPRDACIGIGAFLGVGMADEARRFMAWLLHASRLDRPRLPVLFTIHGRRPLPERELNGWPGYRGSHPVRVGNAAVDQHQLDVYGWALDAAFLMEDAGHRLYSETWRAMSGFADEVARRWSEPDAGIWEIRGDQSHHVHSHMMGWLALDRALRIAEWHRVGRQRRQRWMTQRAAIAAQVRTRGVHPTRGYYTRTYDSNEADAALLVLPLLGIEAPGSPRTIATIDAIRENLGAGGPLLYRYPPGSDGLPGGEGAFLPCSFWLVQALAKIGRTDEAESLFTDALSCASPLGLFAEELDPTSRVHLGNFPQALTHAAVVQAALAIRDSP
jgi:GH15 family glucan-1,4-alpha-glucosidase